MDNSLDRAFRIDELSNINITFPRLTQLTVTERRAYLSFGMDKEVIAGMRARIQQLKKVMSLAHDPRMIALLEEVVESGEADVQKLEAETAKEEAVNSAPLQGPKSPT